MSLKKIMPFLSIVVIMGIIFSIIIFQTQNRMTASTIRLETFEGEVVILNDDGVEITTSQGMRLQSGYSIKTKANSIAYITLDESKAIKLNENSDCIVNKENENLEIELLDGELFFNVTVPLKPDENMNITTATIVTGIRGTSGYLTIGDNSDCLTLLTGKVEVYTFENSSDKKMIASGECAISKNGVLTDDCFIITQEMTAEEIPSFVLHEIASDENLTKEIKKQSDIDMNEIIENSNSNNDDSDDNNAKDNDGDDEDSDADEDFNDNDDTDNDDDVNNNDGTNNDSEDEEDDQTSALNSDNDLNDNADDEIDNSEDSNQIDETEGTNGGDDDSAFDDNEKQETSATPTSSSVSNQADTNSNNEDGDDEENLETETEIEIETEEENEAD